MESDDLTEKLPIALTPDDVERNPEFGKLLKTLTQHILPSGASATSQEDVQEVKGVLHKQKQQWLLQHTLYTELQELILAHQLQSAQNTSSSNAEFYSAVSDQLTQAEIVDYVDCSPEPGSDVKLFGLTAEKLERLHPRKLHQQSMQQRIIPDLESRLRRRCETLVGFHSPSQSSSSCDGRFDFAKASQLPTIIANEHQELVNGKQLLKKETAECRKLQMHYSELLLESFKLLSRLITEHRLKSQPENDAVNVEWLAARCDALCLKIKVLELQLMCDTYYAETVDALKTIRSELDKSIADTERDLSQSTTALRAYESVGSDFDSVVQEFTQIRSDIENKRWALHELKKHPLNTSTSDADRTLFS